MNRDQNLPIAVQLYTLRYYPDTFSGILEQVAAAGYKAVELVHTHGLPAPDLRAALEKHGIRPISAHVSVETLQTEPDSVIEFHRAIGNDTVIVPGLPESMRGKDSARAWHNVGRLLNLLGSRYRDAGLRLGYHNHAFEMATVDGKLALDWMLESTDPENLFFEPDLAWIVRGGVNPLELLERYQGRCRRIHVKDIAPAGQNEDEDGWADVGYGILDWEQLLPAAKATGAEWYIVEHDNPRDPVKSICRSMEFLRSQADLL